MQHGQLDSPRLDFLSVFTGTIANLESRLQIYVKKKEKEKKELLSQRNTGGNRIRKVLQKVDIAETLTAHLIQEVVPMRVILWAILVRS